MESDYRKWSVRVSPMTALDCCTAYSLPRQSSQSRWTKWMVACWVKEDAMLEWIDAFHSVWMQVGAIYLFFDWWWCYILTILCGKLLKRRVLQQSGCETYVSLVNRWAEWFELCGLWWVGFKCLQILVWLVQDCLFGLPLRVFSKRGLANVLFFYFGFCFFFFLLIL